MAIDANDYVQTKEKNIKLHKKDKRLFLFDFRIDGKRYRESFRVKATNHSPKDNLKNARLYLEELKENLKNGYSSSSVTLDKLFIDYMSTQPQTDWTHKKKHIYDLYIGESGLSNITKEPTPELVAKRKAYNKFKIGFMKIDNIRPLHIEKITSRMATEHNLSPRTQKSILEILSPLFNFAMRNKYMSENPAQDITIKIPSQKKIVTNASELFRKVYIGITEYYKDEPFYKALFLFGFTGRRKSEILNLKWENIDLNADYYWIEDTKNGEQQRYPLPAMVRVALLEMATDRSGLVFKSPITGKALAVIDRQMQHLKTHTGVDNLTLHYMRNILVSALAEQSTEAVTLSGILGHRDINTINKYLSNSTMKSGLKGLKAIDIILDTEIVHKGSVNE
jgi:integrase